MKHGILLMVACFLGLTSLKLGDRYIHWSSNRPLVWSDFQGQPTYLKDTLYGAVTNAFLDNTPYKKNPFFIYLVSCFDKQTSWVTVDDSLGLIHEQGHFDIVEIYARKYNNEFKDLKMKATEKDLPLQTKRFNEIAEEMNKIQLNYDKETQCHLNQPEQTRWNKWIKRQLDSIPKIEFE